MAKYSNKIGFIPDDWEFINAKDCLFLESGMRPKEYVTDIDTDIPSLGGENIDESGCLIFENIRYIDSSYYKKMKKGHIHDEDIYINKDGANTGKVAFCKIKPFKECAVNEHVFLIRNDGTFKQQYLFYCLLSNLGKQQILKKIIGSAQEGINNSFTKGIILPKPSLPEQASIANILSKVDEAIESVKKSIEAAEKLKKSLMQNLLTGRMKPDGTLRTEEEFYEDEKFGKVPIGWEVKKVKELGKVITGKTPPTEEPNVFSDEERGFMFVTPGDVGVSKYIERTQRYVSEKGIKYSYRIPKDSVCVICIGSTIGKIGITTQECCTNQQITTIVINDHNYYEYFYYAMLGRKEHLKSVAGINATPQINKSEYSKYKIICPISKQEQIKIAQKISAADKDITNKQNQIITLERLKKSLMQNLLTGKVRVGEEGKK